ncbi:GntR family transcriptional regulator [Kushneria pakistanensis]|uniref:GntR family transcriptional regulator n=1 Tax=Kushneria pakistanensis TaxID=1508770 RepID=A0ABQ3FM84_9GAMM|nr:FadR/GntR family transcriptional regulator [Kushneria pakistanensis]GHC29629.1 GntR family transcriptional regulator [Kushneria pakistanensis]
MAERQYLPHAAANADASALASTLAHTILSGQWACGDTFPRELDLCQHFATSRNRVRNALATLSACGLIERTAGRGTIVRDISQWHLLDPNMSTWLSGLDTPHPQLVHEVFAFRLAAEPYVSELAALSATAWDLAQIERAFNGMCDTAHDPDQRSAHIDYDVAFHDAIYCASHNLVWRQMGTLLRPSIVALIQRSHHRVERLDDSLERHRRVLEAIRMRQPDTAREATEHVLARTATDLELSGRPPELRPGRTTTP